MILRFHPYNLELRHAFTLATNSRTTTLAMMVEVEEDGIVGYGEAAMPPYLGESQESAAAHLSPLVDWADLDGAALIKNDLFAGATLHDGKITPADRPGIGVRKR